MDSDTLRTAAEVVGWLDSDDEGEFIEIPHSAVSCYLDEIEAPVFQFMLDALAAELVRLVSVSFAEMSADEYMSIESIDYTTPWLCGDSEETISAIVQFHRETGALG